MGRIREKNLIVYKTLKRFGNKEYVDFHMPGHKSGQMIPSYLKKNLFKIDTTELSFSDNLDHPKDLLKDLLDDISNEYNSKKSYLLVNGATQGILASITGCVGRNDKIIIARDCHISVFSALEICGAVPTFTEGTNSINDIVCTYEKNKDSKVIFFTSPNYYGKCAETEKIIKFAHENGMIVIVDEAHGSHFTYSENFPKSAVELGADIVIQSMHKTLPVMTQVGLIHLNNMSLIDTIEKRIRMFRSTSPSYVFVVSAEFGFRFMKKSGKIELDRIIEEIDNIGTYQNIQKIENDDKTRIVFDISGTGNTGFEISRILFEKHKIIIEMADISRIVLIATVMNKKSDFKRLKKALKELDGSKKVFHNEEVVIDRSRIDEIAQTNVILYPPGTPIILRGEKISEEKLVYIEKCKKSGGEVLEW